MKKNILMKGITLTSFSSLALVVPFLTTSAFVQEQQQTEESYFSKHFKVINFDNSKESKFEVQIAVLEPGYISQESPDFQGAVKNVKKLDDAEYFSAHKTLVAKIIVGKNGMNPDVQVNDVAYDEYIDFSEKMDYLIELGVDVVNLSYGYGDAKGERKFYDWNAAYLDYLSSRYGITFVFATGNSAEYPEKREDMWGKYVSPYIDGGALALNAIKVGSTGERLNDKWDEFEKLSEEELKEFFSKRSSFSNYLVKNKKFKQRGVNIVAPGAGIPAGISLSKDPEFVNRLSTNKTFFGTSFSAPFVAASLAKLMTENWQLRKKPHASLVLTTLGTKKLANYSYDLENGLNEEVGAGLLDLQEMRKAAQNIKLYELDIPAEDNVSIQIDEYNYPVFEVEAGKNIRGALAWLNNSFSFGESIEENERTFNNKEVREMLKDSFKKAEYSQLSFTPEEDRLSPKKMIKNLNLRLQVKQGNQWVDVAFSESEDSNIESIDYQTEEAGTYRFLVLSKNNAKDFIPLKTRIALSHTVN